MILIDKIKTFISAFIELLYPEYCASCGEKLYQQESVLCTKCIYNIPRTNYHKIQDNVVEQVFWGRVNIVKATSFFFFHKESKYRKLLHKLKYQGRKDIGIKLGQLCGSELIKDNAFTNIDYIIPVPLHKNKQHKRGFNQSEMIAIGLQDFLPAKVQIDVLFRKKDTESQTRKNRDERWENLRDVFDVKNINKLRNKNILLVDDILTTGATIESCINALNKIENIQINVLTIAITK
jgi:ComF family protein